MVTNLEIAEAFELMGKLMELHGENSFKAKSYSSAAYTIEKLDATLDGMDSETMGSLNGIGTAIRQKILTFIQTGHIKFLDELLSKTPIGVLEMMNIKGLGPKKVSMLWNELQIESIGELEYACNENRLTLLKGFGDKTQASVLKNIEFYKSSKSYYRFAEIEMLAESVRSFFTERLNCTVEFTGEFRRRMEVLQQIDLIMIRPEDSLLQKAIIEAKMKIEEEGNDYIKLKTETKVVVVLHFSNTENFYQQLFVTTGSKLFVDSVLKNIDLKNRTAIDSEMDIFLSANLPFINPENREEAMDELYSTNDIIQLNQIKGVVHAHSNWSDGRCTIEEMANESIKKGYEYLCLSDHSQSAFYANGLTPDRLTKQWEEVDVLNKKLAPFKIFKGVESDILFNGNLDYESNVLDKFDFVIASIHSNFKMSKEKATERIVTAIQNPFTTILGHPTGRLLLSREGYPVDMMEVIKACAKHNVIIELNAHPWRLDIDWRLIQKATEAGVKISINPDAHNLTGIGDIRYGVMVAQKGGLKYSETFNALSREEVSKYFENRKSGIKQSV